jgi:hypothetical protein
MLMVTTYSVLLGSVLLGIWGCGSSADHVFPMSDTEELAPDDVLGWELDQLAKLKRLADAYGWDEDTPQYKAKVKQLQALGKQRLADALGKGGGKEPKAKAPSYVWESCLEFTAKGWDEAKLKLDKVHTGDWLPDRRCPQTTSGGMVVRRFLCTDTTEGKRYLARLLDLTGGKWRLQRGNVEEADKEDKESDDEDDGKEGEEGGDGEEGGGPSERRGTAAPAKKARPAAAAAPAPAPAATMGKRVRKPR